jgi:hypothetical protein
MTLSIDSAKAWVKSNPLLAGGIAIATVGVLTLAFSKNARKAVGLGRAPVRRRRKNSRVTVKRLK